MWCKAFGGRPCGATDEAVMTMSLCPTAVLTCASQEDNRSKAACVPTWVMLSPRA